ncbi:MULTISPECIES: DUF3084 domain-containing protein [Nostocales]|jgi:uncharacterized protein (DUF3084 family)|uniref:DUF3084 domain-containing protein n=1 Tax=Dolichospermum flos-aquae UHCC 0037 TaxID=2590026 RepID=A0ACC7S0E4_DOLFA|nr:MULTISPECIES: DUF3084 domain-containing protein [Nostocales]MCX5982315.1 DUF3084 domain-containing protein [Nostocales cyanobacterium LacPavin_0920_SED1_MAG_38_18]QSV73341.1 MAG: DUF3084 domain-containing protein [Aphanizomenon flos-aquae KM1D3_PB]ALB40522.1 hypothetical protein AA650_08590 [Anabaena sp. WA102]MBO1066365.1 DUF3084 domain-containing protein [Anabaena sp. 54]MTJ41835.1 DUF3084 domain-containing protein [Dolichospermum flos-aquae UHCC 0037]
MATGYILIAAILILGGVIATVGDRIGTRVGKARLSLFNLRPKKTAVIVTIFTGGLISASTLAILFAADGGLRKGVFELEDIQRDLGNKREQLKIAEAQKSQVESELNKAKQEQSQAQEELQKINKSLQAANTKQKTTQAQLNRTLNQQAKTQARLNATQSHLGGIVIQYQQARSELQTLYNQRQTLQTAVEELKAERKRLYAEAKQAIDEAKTVIEKRDRKIVKLDKLIQNRNLEIKQREEVIMTRESRLKELEKQQQFLEQEVARLEKYYQSYRDLRLGKLALVKGQVIAAGLITVDKPDAAQQAIIQILQEANRNANIQLTEPGAIPANKEILRVTKDQVKALVAQIKDGREYVVRIFSAGNYVRGEKQIEFFADAARNQLVFSSGEVLATTTADLKNMTSEQMRQRLDLLISASQFRARNAGIVESVQIEGTFPRFVTQLQQTEQEVEIKAVAAENTYTVGPLRVKLVALLNGQILFST